MKRMSFPPTATLAALFSIAAALPASSSAAIYSSDLSITIAVGRRSRRHGVRGRGRHGATVVSPNCFHACIPPLYHFSLWAG
jgi:hypothetical protein